MGPSRNPSRSGLAILSKPDFIFRGRGRGRTAVAFFFTPIVQRQTLSALPVFLFLASDTTLPACLPGQAYFISLFTSSHFRSPSGLEIAGLSKSTACHPAIARSVSSGLGF
jgi:hypothetical protein